MDTNVHRYISVVTQGLCTEIGWRTLWLTYDRTVTLATLTVWCVSQLPKSATYRLSITQARLAEAGGARLRIQSRQLHLVPSLRGRHVANGEIATTTSISCMTGGRCNPARYLGRADATAQACAADPTGLVDLRTRTRDWLCSGAAPCSTIAASGRCDLGAPAMRAPTS